jgi:hypothetical protein
MDNAITGFGDPGYSETTGCGGGGSMIDVAEVGDLGRLRAGSGRVRSIQNTGVGDPGYSDSVPDRSLLARVDGAAGFASAREIAFSTMVWRILRFVAESGSATSGVRSGA